MTKIKYLHIVYKISEGMRRALEEVPRRGGMYNWLFLFKGSMMAFHDVDKDILDKYDVVQVNMSPVDQVLVKEVRKLMGENSSQLLIANNDYVCESWQNWQQHPLEYQQTMEVPDALFGTEPYQTSHMREGSYVIPHPHWIKMLKHIGNDDLDMDKYRVGTLYHWWEGRTYNQSVMLEKLRSKYPKLFTRLYGYNGQGDVLSRWNKVMFDKTMPLMSYPDFLRSLMTNRFIQENCSYHTYGRTTVDTAAVGVPAMGTDRVFSMKHCYPEMCADPFDATKQLEIMDKILKGGSWLDEQMDYAYEACEYFSYKNAESRYLQMCDETKDRLKK